MHNLLPRVLPVLLALFLGAGPASAHKMKVFAAVEGDAIVGYAYFSPGGRVREASLVATAPDGTVLFNGRTAEDGTFRIPVTRRVDYRITVDGGDAHVASTKVVTSELSGPDGPDAAAASQPAALTIRAAAKDAAAVAAFDPALLRPLIEQAVAKEVRPLREALDAAQETIWMHDVLGGLGMILGLFGFAYGFATRRREGRSPQSRPASRYQPS